MARDHTLLFLAVKRRFLVTKPHLVLFSTQKLQTTIAARTSQIVGCVRARATYVSRASDRSDRIICDNLNIFATWPNVLRATKQEYKRLLTLLRLVINFRRFGCLSIDCQVRERVLLGLYEAKLLKFCAFTSHKCSLLR